MVSYNKVNDEYAAASKFLLTEVLRKKWGFKGMVISDWGACIGAANCLKAGMSLAMPDSNGYFSHQLSAMYDEDKELQEKLEEANNLVIDAAKKWNGGHRQKAYNSKIDFVAHHKAALRFATSSAVLLKNDGALPLTPKAKLAVIGGLAAAMKFQGGGSSHINAAEYPSALESLKALGYEIDYAEDAYTPDAALYDAFFTNTFYEQHHRGTFTTADNLADMAKESFAVRMILRFIIRAMLFTMKGKSKDDPSVKIAISAIEENPLESLISITNGVLSEERMRGILRLANRKHK